MIVSSAFIVMRPKISILSSYLFHLIMSDSMTEQIISKTTSDPPAINQTNASKLKIPLPSLEIQQDLITLYEAKQTELQIWADKIKEEKLHLTRLETLARDIISYYCQR